jgi:hypothetical protein
MNHPIRTSPDDPVSILTTEHPASSHGQPILLWAGAVPLGPADEEGIAP